MGSSSRAAQAAQERVATEGPQSDEEEEEKKEEKDTWNTAWHQKIKPQLNQFLQYYDGKGKQVMVDGKLIGNDEAFLKLAHDNADRFTAKIASRKDKRKSVVFALQSVSDVSVLIL